MWRRIPLVSLAAALALTAAGCDDETCPAVSNFGPGNYVSTGGHWSNGPGQFPHDGPAKTLTLERGAGAGDGGVVKVTYTRNGKVIVEKWALTAGRWDPR